MAWETVRFRSALGEDYILDDLTLWEAKELQYELHKEIWRRYKRNEKRDELIDRYDELTILIGVREAQDKGEL